MKTLDESISTIALLIAETAYLNIIQGSKDDPWRNIDTNIISLTLSLTYDANQSDIMDKLQFEAELYLKGLINKNT